MASVRTPTRISWEKMVARCKQKNDRKFATYGAAGITVCDEWATFAGFLKDMGERPAGHTLDRCDGSKGYSKDNCRWATPKEQANNMRSNVFLEYDGLRLTITQWAEKLQLSWGCIGARLSRGLPIDQVLFPGKLRQKAR